MRPPMMDNPPGPASLSPDRWAPYSPGAPYSLSRRGSAMIIILTYVSLVAFAILSGYLVELARRRR